MIKKKKKICVKCNKEKFIYSLQMCHQCYWIDNYQKQKKRQLDRANTSFGYKYEDIMFSEIWKQREHKSFLSGKKLGFSEGCGMYYSMFSHVLNKKDYPEYRLNPDNIILLTPNEHFLLDFGSEKQRNKYSIQNNCDWNIIFDLKEKLKQEYKEKFG